MKYLKSLDVHRGFFYAIIFLFLKQLTNYYNMKQLTLFVFASALVLSSCGGSEKEGGLKRLQEMMERDSKKNVDLKPVKLEIEDVFKGGYEAEQTLVYEGYIGQVPTTISMSGGKMDVRIFPRRNQTNGNYVNLDVTIGTSKNNVKSLPEKYKQEDLIVFADDNTKLGVGDKVRVTATGYYSSTNYFSMEAVTIEAIKEDKFNKDVFDDAVALTSAMVHDTSVHEVYGYMDGVLSIPTVFYSMYGEIALNFKTGTNKDFDKVDIRTGKGPSTMNELPASYTPKDLVVRDLDGNAIKAGAKVRVYGTWQRYSFVSSTGLGGTFKVEEIVKL